MDFFQSAAFKTLYSWQNENLKEPTFILHDGPPYANGSPHIGHVINKVLKDIILRCNILKGRKVNYIPGWDCHGLPIELKAVKKSKTQLSPVEIRQKGFGNIFLETKILYKCSSKEFCN